LSGTNHRINGERLWDSLMRMAEIGATPHGGVRRLALSAEDARGRERFKHWCESLGLAVRVDAMGNMFARREGRDPRRAPVLFGSHLDSQPSGGKFDGALGVLAGLEVMRSLRDLDIATEAPLELVNWTDEEGSRFGHSLMGSGVWAGVYAESKVNALSDVDDVTVGAAEGEELPLTQLKNLDVRVAAMPLLRQSRLEKGEPFFRMREVEGMANAITRIQVLERGAKRWRYGLAPATGRKHQLRVHMAALAVPILNDRVYPELLPQAPDDHSRPLQLLARTLAFTDPLTGVSRHFESRLRLQSVNEPAGPVRPDQ